MVLNLAEHEAISNAKTERHMSLDSHTPEKISTPTRASNKPPDLKLVHIQYQHLLAVGFDLLPLWRGMKCTPPTGWNKTATEMKEIQTKLEEAEDKESKDYMKLKKWFDKAKAERPTVIRDPHEASARIRNGGNVAAGIPNDQLNTCLTETDGLKAEKGIKGLELPETTSWATARGGVVRVWNLPEGHGLTPKTEGDGDDDYGIRMAGSYQVASGSALQAKAYGKKKPPEGKPPWYYRPLNDKPVATLTMEQVEILKAHVARTRRAGATVDPQANIAPIRPDVTVPTADADVVDDEPDTIHAVVDKNRNNLLTSLIWLLVKQKLPVKEVVAEVERLNTKHFTPPYGSADGEESIKQMVDRTVKKYDGGTEVTRKNKLYDHDDDSETQDCLNMLEALGYESRYNELKMRYEVRKVDEESVKAWKDAFDDTLFQSLLLSVRNDLVPRPILVRINKKAVIRRGEKSSKPIIDKNFERQLKGACLRRKENPFLLLLDDLDKWGKENLPDLNVDNIKDAADNDSLVSPTLLEHCFKVHESYKEVARFAMPAMMRAAIMRSYKPGAKYDEVVILCGKQGIGKGEFFKTLLRVLGDDELDMYTEDFDLNCTSKELIENTAGMKFAELSEMAGMRQTDSSKLKAKVSRPKDGARLSWGRTRTDALRQFVFMGSADQTDFLNLPATDFGRRWLVVGIEMHERAEGSRVKSAQWINSSEIALLIKRAWYEQLLLYRAGVKCYVPAELVETIAANVRSHRYKDEEAEELALDFLREGTYYVEDGFCLKDMESILKDKPPSINKQRILKILKGFGFDRKTVRVAGVQQRKWVVVDNKKLPREFGGGAIDP